MQIISIVNELMIVTGVLLAVLEQCEVILPIYGMDGKPSTNAGTVSAGYQNFLVIIARSMTDYRIFGLMSIGMD